MFSTITAAPAKQSVSETIAVLSGRLSTATLLEDRRAAIQGLRSFAKQYPASVASGALRSLIGSLSRDGEDLDTVKVALETLLMLFSPNKDSPEASEEIALWLADEFTQRQENITLLLDLLDTDYFHSRLYSLQLLSAILSARTKRTEECILVAPLGITRLVELLEDRREAIRDEAINLLTDLTPESVDIQMLVASERGFERVFAIIQAEDGLVGGARVVEDCLILLANLLRLNSPNQSGFRDMGFIKKLAGLLEGTYKGGSDQEEVAEWVQAQRSRNIYALLAVLRLFLVSGATGTPQNQEAFLKERVLINTLQLAFSWSAELPIRSEALVACADMIRGNHKLQESFAGLEVPSPLDGPTANGQGPHMNGVPKVFVIDGLLDLILAVNSPQAFDMRMAACTCLKAYFYNHAKIRWHFLNRAIEGHKVKADELTNVLTTLLQPDPDAVALDPYRYWFAAVLMLHLVHENPETKRLAMEVTEGDEASGEEVVTSIQTIAAHFLGSVTRNDDPRVLIGYLMLLLCWLFEDPDAVNDFLGEFTNLQGLIQAAVENPNGDAIVQGLSAMLIGVVYEFSTKDSPVPRAAVLEQVMRRMGRDRYIDKLSRMRSHPLVRDYEVLPQKLDLSNPDQKLPDVFLDDTFVEFFRDNYSRILRGIDREPGLEISVITNGVERGVSRELVDSLRAQVGERDRALEEADAARASLTQQLNQEQADHRRDKEQGLAEITRVNQAAEAMRAQLADKDRAVQTIQGALTSLRQQLNQEQQGHSLTKAEIVRLKAEMGRLETVNKGLHQNHERELAAKDRERAKREDEFKVQLERKEAEFKRQLDAIHKEQAKKEEEFKRQLEAVRKEEQGEKDKLQKEVEAARKAGEQEAERVQRRSEAEKADLKATISRMEVDLMKANKAKQVAEGKVTELEKEVKTGADKLAEVEKKLADAEKKIKAAEEASKEAGRNAKAEMEKKEEEREAAQTELDDLLIVFSDLEEKVAKYKVSHTSPFTQNICGFGMNWNLNETNMSTTGTTKGFG